jgi:hypothetical protein
MDNRPKASAIFLCRWALALLACSSPLAQAEPNLKTYESKYYLIHTDLPPAEAREAQVRMSHIVEAYSTAATGVSGQIKDRLPFYLYKNRDDYTRAGGIENSAGVFDGTRLTALTLRRADGVISLATWHIVQHEGFHQFAHAVIGDQLPMWADEGMAEYFGEALFTGDGFVTGLIPQNRLTRVQKMFAQATDKPLAELMAIPREQWNAKVEMPNYDQAWSLVHFLLHGEDGRLQKRFADFMHDVSTGVDPDKACKLHLGAIPNLETRCRDWWMHLPDYPTSQGYARATLAMLTSFLARSHARGQAFADFDAFSKTLPDELKQPEADWLPPTLFTVATVEANRMRGAGDTLVLLKPADRPPSILLTLSDGTKLAGKFDISKDRRIANVRVELLSKPTPTSIPTARPASR